MTLSAADPAQIRKRYLKLYSALVYDRLEDLGYPDQALASNITPLSPQMMIAGQAFPIKGTSRVQRDERESVMKMLEAMTPDCIAVVDTGHDNTVAHWGELMSTAARARGCLGAVIDGGVRDSRYLLAMEFPIFRRYHTPVEAFGRWGLVDWNMPIYLPGKTAHQVAIQPGDYIFGDLDGVLVIPMNKTLEVLELAEERFKEETIVRQELTSGDSPLEVFRRHGVF